MTRSNNILAIIPARGGSKGIHKKNIRELSGKPLIAYTIEAAKKTELFDQIIVSTDSEEIARISEGYGAQVPFIRPKRLSTDTASSKDVVTHTMQWIENNMSVQYDYFILLQPTSPYRNELHIYQAISMILKHANAKTLVSFTEPKHHPIIMRRINDNGYLEQLKGFSNNNCNRRQDYPPVLAINGAIYIAEWKYFKENETFFGDKCIPYLMDRRSSIDIDSEYDWKQAEILIDNNMDYIE